MSNKDTKVTLVLGAGASYPYKFPLGGELVENLLGGCTTDWPGELGPLWDFSAEGIDSAQWRSDHDKMVHNLRFGRPLSIDAFLQTRVQFREIAKYGIARRLLQRERFAMQQGLLATDWYQRLFYAIVRPNWQLKCKLRVVTFNYDRSFELAMLTMYHHVFDREARMDDLCKAIPIIHVYGALEDDIHQNALAAPDRLERVPPPSVCLKASNGIYVMPEDRSRQDDRFQRAEQLIRTADYVYFLGFGFDPLNVKRLGLLHKPGDVPGLEARPAASATTFGVEEQELTGIRLSLGMHQYAGEPNCWCGPGAFSRFRCEPISNLSMLRRYSIFPALCWDDIGP